jgi:hypothetical protein
MSRSFVVLCIPHFKTSSSYKKMDSRRVRSDPRSRDVSSSGGEFIFQSETRGSSKGQGSIRLGLKNRKDITPTSTFRRDESSSRCQKSLFSHTSSELRRRERLPQTSEDNAPSTLTINEVIFINGQQSGDYMAKLPSKDERTNHLTLPTNQGYCEISAPYICMS